MAEENNMGAFFANKKKKGKKKGVKSPGTNLKPSLDIETPVDKSSSVAVDSGWADNVEEKKAIINTSGKSVVDLSNDKAPVVKENKETGNKFNMEETKNIFQSARAAGQAKGDAVEVVEPVKKMADMTWKEKMELRKKTGGGPLKMDDERAFPTLGGKSGASSAGGAWGNFVKDDAETEGGGESDGEDQDADAAQEE